MIRPPSTLTSQLRLSLRAALTLIPPLLAMLGGAHAFAADPLHTNQPKFRIPFEYDAEEMARLRAVEIQLFVSTNQGREWEHQQSVIPSDAKFTFEADEDGEYWFAVRTLDSANQRHPAGPLQPGLRVVIDRTAPQLEISLRESTAGEVELTWSADDAQLDLSSLKLEFLDPNLTEWQPVAVSSARTGRTAWTVPLRGRVLVRGTISDLARNITTANASVELGSARPAAPAAPRPDFSQPVAGNPDETAEVAESPEPSMLRSSLPTSDQPLIQPLPLVRDDFPQIVSPPSRATETEPAPDPEVDGAESTRAASSAVARVNSTRFHLNYEVDAVGPSGVGGVDLYISEDDGQKWYIYGNDEDRKSPFVVEVPDDGVYGFALRVQSGVGLASEPPQPGQAPEMSIVVDRRPPRAELLPIQQESGASQTQVRIQWRVTDDQLAEQPVALSYASQATGPWQPITGWSENTGDYTWRVASGIPSSVYVRLEARDAAGNVTRVDSETPLVFDLTRPSARIVDVESVTPEESPR